MDDKKELLMTVKNEAHVEFEEKRSIFIGHVLRADTEEEAQGFIKKIKKQYADATHNVFAYMLQGDIIARYSDDGEPQGTAGMPVLDVIRKRGVRNVCVVVTRYFGGTLLGAGGLVRAYSHSAAIALDEAGVVTYEPYTEYELNCNYSDYQKYTVIISDSGAFVDGTDFAESVTVRFAIRKTLGEGLVKKLIEVSNGRAIIRPVGERLDCR